MDRFNYILSLLLLLFCIIVGKFIGYGYIFITLMCLLVGIGLSIYDKMKGK